MTLVNEVGWDPIVRIALGGVMLVLGWSGLVGGTLGILFQWLGFVPLITGLVGWCPIYAVARIRTRKS